MVTATRLILGVVLIRLALGQVVEPAGSQGFVLAPGQEAPLAHGSDDIATRTSQTDMENFFLQDKGIPSDRVLRTRSSEGNALDSSPDQLKGLIEEAKKKNCKKLYVYIGSACYIGQYLLGTTLTTNAQGQVQWKFKAMEPSPVRLKISIPGMTLNTTLWIAVEI